MLTANDFRRAARAACEINDAITGVRTEVLLYADIDLDHGGAWVDCRVWVADQDASDNNESGEGMNTAAPATHQEN